MMLCSLKWERHKTYFTYTSHERYFTKQERGGAENFLKWKTILSVGPNCVTPWKSAIENRNYGARDLTCSVGGGAPQSFSKMYRKD